MVQSVFSQDGEVFLGGIFVGKPLTARNGGGESGDEPMTNSGSYASTSARRLMRVDGLLRLFINLIPAMVARVTSWSHSKYD